MRHFGLILDPIQDTDHVFGGLGDDLKEKPLNPSGNWLLYIPSSAEYQNLGSFEPSACATFGTTNAEETLENFQFGAEVNYSDRWLAKVSETSAVGNSPHKVAEFRRKLGNVNEEDWPFVKTSFDDYYSPLSPKSFELARKLLKLRTFTHQYVSTSPQLLLEALTYSPVGISVTAWHKDGLLYRFPKGLKNNHWVLLVNAKEGEWWEVLDSYPDDGQPLKKIAWNEPFEIAKRYKLSKATHKLWLLELLERLTT